jgi:hypothetical protein
METAVKATAFKTKAARADEAATKASEHKVAVIKDAAEKQAKAVVAKLTAQSMKGPEMLAQRDMMEAQAKLHRASLVTEESTAGLAVARRIATARRQAANQAEKRSSIATRLATKAKGAMDDAFTDLKGKTESYNEVARKDAKTGEAATLAAVQEVVAKKKVEAAEEAQADARKHAHKRDEMAKQAVVDLEHIKYVATATAAHAKEAVQNVHQVSAAAFKVMKEDAVGKSPLTHHLQQQQQQQAPEVA